MHHHYRTAVAVAVVAALSGCFGNGAQRETASKPAQRMTEDRSRAASPSEVQLAAEIIAPAIEALVARTGAARGDIRVARAVPVKWNDGSLGCPQPGVAYTMAITPGYWVVLEHAGKLYSYHGGPKARYTLCENAQIDARGVPPHGRLNEDV